MFSLQTLANTVLFCFFVENTATTEEKTPNKHVRSAPASEPTALQTRRETERPDTGWVALAVDSHVERFRTFNQWEELCQPFVGEIEPGDQWNLRVFGHIERSCPSDLPDAKRCLTVHVPDVMKHHSRSGRILVTRRRLHSDEYLMTLGSRWWESVINATCEYRVSPPHLPTPTWTVSGDASSLIAQTHHDYMAVALFGC